MPTPIDLLLNPISLAVIGIYACFMLYEALNPARPLPRDYKWMAQGLGAFVLFFFISSYLPMLWTTQLAAYQLFDLTSLGHVAGALIGLLVYELGQYAWHRTMHNSPLLWKVFHRKHHTPDRLDSYGAYYFSLADMIGWTALSSLCLTLLVGITAEAATFVLLATNLFSVFQHANIKTPQWLGYLVQRPESHTAHHARGIHKFNYADIPIYDMMFGTFRNPKSFEYDVGLGRDPEGKRGRSAL